MSERTIVQDVCDNNARALEKVTARNLDMSIYSLPSKDIGNKPLEANQLTLAHIAAFYDSLECFVYIYKKTGGESLNKWSAHSNTPLQYACVNGSLEVATFILSLAPKQENQELLLYAVFGKSPEMVNVLFNYCGTKAFTDVEVATAYRCAIEVQCVDCMKLLLHRGRAKVTGESLLMAAVKHVYPEAVRLLLEAGENPDYVNGATYDTPLRVACYFKNERCVELLLEKIVSPDPKPAYDTGAVFWICESHNVRIARMMLEKGIDVNRLDEHHRMGVSRLVDRATEDESIEIMELMLRHGWDINNERASVLAIGEFMDSIEPHKYMNVIKWLVKQRSNLNSFLRFSGHGRPRRVIDELERDQKWEAVRKDCAQELRDFREIHNQ